MYIMSPIAWPTAKLLDYLLGQDHGTVYKKAGLKTLVTLHQSLGKSPGEQLNEDEVTIITAVLDLKAETVRSIMTPIDDVYTMSSETVLDEKTVDGILAAGCSRIPIHTPDSPQNFIGMLLVRTLLTTPKMQRRCLIWLWRRCLRRDPILVAWISLISFRKGSYIWS
jgi:metal transporter CNNM